MTMSLDKIHSAINSIFDEWDFNKYLYTSYFYCITIIVQFEKLIIYLISIFHIV